MEMHDDENSTSAEKIIQEIETTTNNIAENNIENPLTNIMTNTPVDSNAELNVQNPENMENQTEEIAVPETTIAESETILNDETSHTEIEHETPIFETQTLHAENAPEPELEVLTPSAEAPINEDTIIRGLNPEEEINTIAVEEVFINSSINVPVEEVNVDSDTQEILIDGQIVDATHPAMELEAGSLHFDNLTKLELVKAAQDACKLDNLRDAADQLKALRPIFENVIREEQQKELAEFIEGGGERDAYIVSHDPTKDQFYASFEILKKRKEEQRLQIEKQKQENLKLKQGILEKIKAIVDGEESKDSIEQIKFLQSEWKRIKVIPQELSQSLWDTYSFYIDKFYDNRSIFYELKELDRQKNLSAKIELCLRVDELKNQTSMKQCMILLNKYHEDWKNIGPVPKEVSEELWQRFKGASDVIHDRFRHYLTELEAIQTVNLQQKRELLTTAQEIAQKAIEKGKDWNERSKEFEALLNEWKKIGMVPREHNNIWDNFRGIIDEFYKQKNNHFKELNKGRMENYRKKEELCVKAEALKESTDWGRTSKELVQLQDQWKAIGAVPDKYNETIWKRFRSACDTFFNAKTEKFASQKGEYSQNLEVKNGIIAKLEGLASSEDYGAVAKDVRMLQEEWNSTGHVEIKVKDALYKRYNAALDALYTNLRKHSSEFEQNQNRQRFENLAQQQDGKFKLQSESRKLQDRIRVLQENIDTLQNNIGFFANSKNADSLKKKVEEDIAAHQKNIVKLKEQLQVLRGLTSPQPTK